MAMMAMTTSNSMRVNAVGGEGLFRSETTERRLPMTVPRGWLNADSSMSSISLQHICVSSSRAESIKPLKQLLPDIEIHWENPLSAHPNEKLHCVIAR